MEQILERQKIVEVCNRLFIETDNKNWDEVQNCFSEQVNFDMTSMGAEKIESFSPQQITDMWQDGLKHVKELHHQVSNFLVDGFGNMAEVFCYGTAWHHSPEEDTRTKCFVGSYDFKLVKESNTGWKINLFKFNLKFIQEI